MRIFLIGYMGAGKTTIGRALAKRLQLDFVDMDTCIEKKQGKTVAQIFAECGEAAFREMERACLLEVIDSENVVVSTGGGAPCFFDNMDLMNQHGETVYIQLAAGELSRRLKTTTLHKRPLLANQHGADFESFIAAGLAKREPHYTRAKFTVSGTDAEIEQQLVAQFLSEKK